MYMVVVLKDGKWEFYDNNFYSLAKAIVIADGIENDWKKPQKVKVVQFLS